MFQKNSKSVIPQTYCVLDPSSHSRKDCKKADKNNEKLFKSRNKIYQNTKTIINQDTLILNEPENLPQKTNLERYCIWVERNKPTSANKLSQAVTLLLENNYVLDVDYSPQTAIQFCFQQKGLKFQNSDQLFSNDENYILLSDDEILKTSNRKLRKLDKQNLKTQEKKIKTTLIHQRRLSTISTGNMIKPINSSPRISNFDRKLILKMRNIQVSAELQCKAIIYLYEKLNLKLYKNFEPQNAIGLHLHKISSEIKV